jgi:hypothetical protein
LFFYFCAGKIINKLVRSIWNAESRSRRHEWEWTMTLKWIQKQDDSHQVLTRPNCA